MEAPFCRICQHRHYGVAHVFDSTAGKAVVEGGMRKEGVRRRVKVKAKVRGRGRPATGFDKVAYQREYMRARRAKVRRDAKRRRR